MLTVRSFLCASLLYGATSACATTHYGRLTDVTRIGSEHSGRSRPFEEIWIIRAGDTIIGTRRMALVKGDRIVISDSLEAVIRLVYGYEVTLFPGSEIGLLNPRLQLAPGSLRARRTGDRPQRRLRMQTTYVVAGVGGTDFLDRFRRRSHPGSARYILGCLFTYQIGLLYRYIEGDFHQVNIKALLRSA
jgi:hypothetical protein